MTSRLTSFGRTVGRRTAGSLAGAFLVTMALTASLLSPSPVATPAPEADELELVGCIGACAHPTNAGKVFRWGREKWRDEFETGAFPAHWTATNRKAIGMQHGMLTLKVGAKTKQLIAWPRGKAAKYGRWETRMRAVELGKTGAQFQFNWELGPAGGSMCQSKKIVMAAYTPGDRRVRGTVRTKPDHAFNFTKPLDLRSRAWHTYAVEVTRDHISWFVDTKVIRTERRPKALAGDNYRPQFVITGVKGKKMRPSWLQMDWVRHYTLERPNAKSIKAPKMTKSSYHRGCDGTKNK